MTNKLRIGIPKGSLQDATISLFSKAGISFYGSERSLWLISNDVEVEPVLLRPQEIPVYVANGKLDCGLSGLDWIKERRTDDDIRILASLNYSKRSFRPVRWVLAVSHDSSWETLEDLRLKANHPIRISTELKAITEEWCAERGINAIVDFSWGATEAKAPEFADAIVEATETGASLYANNLRILETVFESTTQFFANREIYKGDGWKRTKLDSIALLLKSCMAAETKVGIRVQAPCSEMDILRALIPSSASFSVWDGHDRDILLEVIADKDTARDLIPILARNGANKISVASIEMLYE